MYNLDYRIDIIMWYIFFYILIVVVIIVLNLPCDLRALCGSLYALNNFICFIIVIVTISLLLLHAAQVNYVCFPHYLHVLELVLKRVEDCIVLPLLYFVANAFFTISRDLQTHM